MVNLNLFWRPTIGPLSHHQLNHLHRRTLNPRNIVLTENNVGILSRRETLDVKHSEEIILRY